MRATTAASPTAARVAIVTGASQGIGAALARRFADDGHKVVLTDFVQGEVERVAAEINAAYPGADAVGLSTDVSDLSACGALVAATIARHGRLDVLAWATAVVPPRGPLQDLEPAEWDRVMTINAKGAFLLVKSVIPALTTPGGSIVFVHSALGQVGAPGAAVYSASKGALGALIKSLAIELAPSKITVNGVAPWHVDAGLNNDALRGAAAAEGITVEEVRARRDSAIPLKRQAAASEIADAMAFLASPQAAS